MTTTRRLAALLLLLLAAAATRVLASRVQLRHTSRIPSIEMNEVNVPLVSSDSSEESSLTPSDRAMRLARYAKALDEVTLNECYMCLEPLASSRVPGSNQMLSPPCGHALHHDCAEGFHEYKKNRMHECGFCRKLYTDSQAFKYTTSPQTWVMHSSHDEAALEEDDFAAQRLVQAIQGMIGLTTGGAVLPGELPQAQRQLQAYCRRTLTQRGKPYLLCGAPHGQYVVATNEVVNRALMLLWSQEAGPVAIKTKPCTPNPMSQLPAATGMAYVLWKGQDVQGSEVRVMLAMQCVDRTVPRADLSGGWRKPSRQRQGSSPPPRSRESTRCMGDGCTIL